MSARGVSRKRRQRIFPVLRARDWMCDEIIVACAIALFCV